jgi:methylglutaconyl-CoA hydratase
MEALPSGPYFPDCLAVPGLPIFDPIGKRLYFKPSKNYFMTDYQFIEFEIADRIAYISLNRPEKRNALNDVMVAELRQAFALAEEDESVKVVILRANGKAFCAGADLEYLRKLQTFTLEQNLADSNALAEIFRFIYRSTKVYIALVEGHAIAGGCGLVTVCDFAFSVPEAKFGYSEVRIGFIPAIVMFFLLRKIGETKAKEMLLTGEIIAAEAAQAFGLINRVIPADKIQEEVQDFAEMLCTKNSAASMQLTKKMIADIQSFPVDNALSFAAKMNAHSRATEDCVRGIQSFLNKEEISW